MKKPNFLLLTVIAICVSFSFSSKKTAELPSVLKVKVPESVEYWYICTNCCKTKKSTSSPWENGCKKGSSEMHNYSSCGKAGDYNYTCRNCNAEIYLTLSASPSASTCCGTDKGTHTWYHK